MKTKEQIKEEYDKYELQEEVIKNKVSLDAILEIAKNDLFENVRVTTKEKRANKIVLSALLIFKICFIIIVMFTYISVLVFSLFFVSLHNLSYIYNCVQ